ncbi:hypothetical protein ABPG72_011696 [Tetrahymena utriculariae]
MTTKQIDLTENHLKDNQEQQVGDCHEQKTDQEHHSALQKIKERLMPHLVKILNHIQEKPHERKALVVLGAGVVYFFLGVFSIHFNISMMMILGSIGFILISKIKKAKKEGIINKVSPGLRTLLLKRSIFDILCDLWYFPIIPKYLKAIFGPFIFKKDPEVTVKNFDELHPKFKQLVLTKGMINILPVALKNFLLPANLLDINSDQVNDSDENSGNEHGQPVSAANLSTRDNSDTSSNGQHSNIPYLKERNFVHYAIEELNKDVLQKNQSQKSQQKHVPGTTELVICSQDVQNQIKREKLLKYLQGNVQEKYYKAHHYHFVKANKEKNSSFSQDPRLFLLKFLQGSKHVSEKERKNLKKALFLATVVLGTQLYFSKQSRHWLKQTVLYMIYMTAIVVSTGSFVLLSKHKKASKKINQEASHQEEI